MDGQPQGQMTVDLRAQGVEGRVPLPLAFSEELGALLVGLRRAPLYPLVQGRLASSSATIWTAEADYEEVGFCLTENDGSDRTATIYLLPPGAAAAAAAVRMLVNALPLPAGSAPFPYVLPFGVPKGYILAGLCSNANSVTCIVFGRRAR